MAAEKRQVSSRPLLYQSFELTSQEEEARIARKEASKGQPRAQSPEEDETPGIQSIHDATVTSRTKSKAAAPVIEEEEDVDIPELIDTSLTTLQEVLDKADVVVQVVDARDIAGGRSKFIEDLVQEAGGKIVLLVNKIGKLANTDHEDRADS
jgi:nuclear GTP-binding protein